MSKHWAWFPSEVHTNTGRLCSAGSGRYLVPRRLSSSAGLPTPCPLRPPLRFPLRVAYLAAGASSVPLRPTTHALANVSCVGDGSPALRTTGMRHRGEGLPGYGAVLFVRAMVEHPAGDVPLLAHLTERLLWPSGNSAPWASGKVRGFGAATPWPTRSHAYASPRPFLTPSQGLLPARAGSPFAGWVSHPLDNTQSFMESLPPPIPFRPQGLVALNFLLCCRYCPAPFPIFSFPRFFVFKGCAIEHSPSLHARVRVHRRPGMARRVSTSQSRGHLSPHP